MILTITGPSGSGKTTLTQGIRAANLATQPLQSITTRAPRPSDGPGELTSVSDAEFDALVEQDAFLWHVAVHSYRFGTRKKAIEEGLAGGMFVAILVIEAVEVLHAYAKELGKTSALQSLYLELGDTSELRKRLTERGDTADIEERIAECLSWNERAHASPAPFVMLDARKPIDVLLQDALQHLL